MNSKCSCGRLPNITCYRYYKTNQPSYEVTPAYYAKIKKNAAKGKFKKNRELHNKPKYMKKVYHRPSSKGKEPATQFDYPSAPSAPSVSAPSAPSWNLLDPAWTKRI